MSGMFKFFLIAVLAVSSLAILVSAYKTKRFFSCVFLSALQGIIAIFAVNAAGLVTDISLPLNGYTIASSIIGGTPAVIGLLILETVF